MKKILVASSLAFSLSSVALAEGKNLSILAGVDRGGVALGANFELDDSATESYGGYVRVFSKDKDEGAPAVFAFGGSFRGHFKHGLFDYYLSPGFGLIHHNYDDTRILVGPSLAYGVTAELDKNSAIGIENTKLYSWAGKYKGLIQDAFLAQFRWSFQ